jgi:hypothetical protein
VPRSIAPPVQEINALLDKMQARAYSTSHRPVSDLVLGLLRRMLEPAPAQRAKVEVRRGLAGLLGTGVAGGGRAGRSGAGPRCSAAVASPGAAPPRAQGLLRRAAPRGGRAARAGQPTHMPAPPPAPLQEILEHPWYCMALPEGSLALNDAFLELDVEDFRREQSFEEIQLVIEQACGKWRQAALLLAPPPAHPPLPLHPLPLQQQPGGVL